MRALLPILLALVVLTETAAADPHLVLDPPVAERRLAQEPFAIVSSEPTPSGVAGARRLVLRLSGDGMELKVKWKAAPGPAGEGWNNVPRKEIAAYAVQQWLLEPSQYVVPPVVARCIPLSAYSLIDDEAEATFPGSACVFGALSLWLYEVRGVDRVIDHQRYQRDPVYAYHIGNVNLLGYLIEHHDGRKSNFLISTDENDPRIFSVDNGIAFGGWMFNYFAANLSKLRVPALPRSSVERLRKVSRERVHALGVLAQYRLDESGVFVPAAVGENLNPDRGTRLREGVLQLGLTADEIENVAERIDELFLDLERGRVEAR